ncbi:ribonuclease H-like domain-containing protein [Fennellomyces sp. T-0311]|nr:ribonuclease H-like domain-containing protein [Fennellomyces sp. T-0311]
MTVAKTLDDENQSQPKKHLPQCAVSSSEDEFPEFDDLDDDDLETIEQEMARVEANYLKKKGTRVMFLDIEAMPRGKIFPEPRQDKVLQISSICAFLLPNWKPYFESYVFTLGTCLPIDDAIVVECDDERSLLKQWRDLVVEFDPDMLSGYYFQAFDLRYLIQRADHLKLKGFAYFGRKKRQKVKVTDTEPYRVLFVSGRTLVDLYNVIRKAHKLPSYKLNAVSLHFLGKQKEDVDYQEIPYLQRTSSKTRQRLAKYCLKDSMLVLELFVELGCLSNRSSGNTQVSSTPP